MIFIVSALTGCELRDARLIDSTPPSGEASSEIGATNTQVDAVGSIPLIQSEAAMAGGWTFPLDAYALTNTQINLVLQAVYSLEGKCMIEKGFAWSPWPTHEEVASLNRLVFVFGTGILSEVQEFGYDLPPKYVATKTSVIAAPLDKQYDAAFNDALYGPVENRPEANPIPIGGFQITAGATYTPDSCAGIANEALGISPDRYRELHIGNGSAEAANIYSESLERAESDPRVVQITQEWSVCMANRGFLTPNPTEASITYGPVDRNIAIAAATADVQCKYETNYFGIKYTAMADHQRQLIDQGLAGLETLAASNKEILEKANAVIEAG